MRSVPRTAQALPAQGDIRLKWTLIPEHEIAAMCGGKQHIYGCAWVFDGFVQLYVSESVGFSDVCKLARFGHEVGHAVGAEH